MQKKYFGRVLLAVGLILLVTLFAWETFSEELSIIEVRRNIPLADNDPVYKDFFINGGTDAGLKKNMTLNVLRKISLRDATGTQNYGELMAPVAQLKIIFVNNRVAVAREVKPVAQEESPMLEQVGVMIGDKIEAK